jgi:hypothetical protein
MSRPALEGTPQAWHVLVRVERFELRRDGQHP